jgi:peptidoglycan hydrolase-like protein with peptidoglycan-binding domain
MRNARQHVPRDPREEDQMAAMLARRTAVTIGGNRTMLDVDQTVRRGRRGDIVRLIQEWLCLNDCDVMIDAQYGRATEQAVRDFQGSTGVLPTTGEVDPQTFTMLIRPMVEALRAIDAPQGATLGQMVAAYALQHLRNRAREIGGRNRGPWVRLYLHGDQRPRDPQTTQGGESWSASFVSTVLAQAADATGVAPPLEYHANCTRMAEEARRQQRFVNGERALRNPHSIPTGSILLLRHEGRRDEWHHAGIVTQALERFVRTIEGNTAYNISEPPSGHEVTRQMRSYGNLDFIVLDA